MAYEVLKNYRELFNYTWEWHERKEGKDAISDFKVQVTKVCAEAPVRFEMAQSWVSVPNDSYPVSRYCEAYLDDGRVALPVEATSLLKLPPGQLTPGVTVILRDVPLRWRTHVPDTTLAELVAEQIFLCCKVDKNISSRQEHTEQLKRLSEIVQELESQNDAAEKILRGNCSAFRVLFPPVWDTEQFLGVMLMSRSLLNVRLIDGRWTATLLVERDLVKERAFSFFDEMREL